MISLIDITTSNPPYKVTQLKAAEELKKRMPGNSSTGRLIDIAAVHSGIDSRFIVIPDADAKAIKNFFTHDGAYIIPDTKMRMIEYEKWAKQLAEDAVDKLFKRNELDPVSINRLITISCTGFFAPGLDYFLINKFEIPLSVKRVNIGFMGCAASIIGFNSVLNTINNTAEKELNTLLISVELCSLHLQTESTRDNILANMIFADGCGAALFSSSTSIENHAKLELISTDSILFKNSADYMGWKIGNTGFEMILSSNLPKIILSEAAPAVKNILLSHGVSIDSVKHWALHPGGRAILDALQTGLELDETKMLSSRNILKNFGNMSSASILFVLKDILDSGKISKGEICCAVAFGPGLTMEVALFKGT